MSDEINNQDEFVKEITPKSVDFSRWYTDVIRKAKMADYTPIKGCMVIMPYGFTLWENMQRILDGMIKETGHKNCYFPMFITESMLKKEADHVEGFAPEVAWVTKAGGSELEEPLVLRATSEPIICTMYSKWIKSYRDLPILYNQWANIIRWEKVTRLFLRTTEFLWQEGHTVHRTEEEAEEETLKMLGVYNTFIEKYLAIPVITGRKTDSEKFAGALRTYSLEALMSDGKALQMGTSHNLGQHFAKVFDIKFLDEDQKEKYAWQTSWGVTTRLIGSVIMVHGDDRGLILPPLIAPTQVVIVPIIFDKSKGEVLEKVEKIYLNLKDKFRIESDIRDEYSSGWKYNEYEMKGVPLRMEIGPKDVQKGQVVIVRRDTGEKTFVKDEDIEKKLTELIPLIQTSLIETAKTFRGKNTHLVDSYEDFKEIMETGRGFLLSHWCGSSECESKIKQETTATIRCIPQKKEDRRVEKGKCIMCNGESPERVYFAKAY
ncbi:proline--tRNA ligase [bacterium]|nr:proline--tRNA ligase [bacterium]